MGVLWLLVCGSNLFHSNLAMPIALATIEQNFRANVQELLGMPANSVRRANQQNPPPSGGQEDQYATVLIQDISTYGWDEVTYVDPSQAGLGQQGSGDGPLGGQETTDLTENITGQRHFTASVQFFRGDAMVKANTLTALLQSGGSIAAMVADGICIAKIGPIRNLPALVDTFFENRAQLDIEFNFINQEQVDMPTFATFGGQIDTETESSTFLEPED